jgi:branched-chain amino acid transport system permease protein
MDAHFAIFVFEQLLNGLGYGLMLFLLAAGLTLVFGIMDTMNLAHGSLYMAGAYVAARVHESSGSFVRSRAGRGGVTVLIAAVIIEFLVVRRLYGRDHLAQVLATFGIILIADDAVKAIWGHGAAAGVDPAALAGPVQLLARTALPRPTACC